jgi:calcineurin-like phosphoesterase family protein
VQPADVLALLGDVAVGIHDTLDVINILAPHYKHIIFVPGNHEYYGMDAQDMFKLDAAVAIRAPHNVHVLNPAKVTIDGITFAGATLWSPLIKQKRKDANSKQVATYISDFKQIKGFTPEHCRALNTEHTSFLYSNDHDVTLTHFIPLREVTSERWKDHFLNTYFVGDCMPTSNLHLFGHTHDVIDTNINGTRYVANPHGYHGIDQTNTKVQILTI